VKAAFRSPGAVLPLADPEHRAGVLSVVYVVSYLAMGLPTVVAGMVDCHARAAGTALRAAAPSAPAMSIPLHRLTASD
jgi:hypothetical protein